MLRAGRRDGPTGLVAALPRAARRLGVVLSTAWLGAALAGATGRPPASAALALGWSLGLIVGGRWPLIRWFLGGDRRPPVELQSWSSALAASTTLLVAGAALALGPGGPLVALAAAGAPLSLCYAMGKLGCRAYGCCDWAPGRRPRRFPSLPPILASLSGALAAALAIAQHAAPGSPRVAAAAVAGHAAIRTLDLACRRRSAA
jgi:hypothetical protein